MINIKIRCPHCYLKIACGDDFKGTDVSCPGCQYKIRIPTPHYDLGTDVHGFIIEQWLGNGAMGEVYLAKQVSMERMIALKIMPEHNLKNDEDKQRFVREVQTLANLNHPNIVSAIEAGEYEGGAYLAMNFIDGMSVEDKIVKEGPISEKLALRICETIADGLEHAWEKSKLIHRDLKPANFMIDKDNEIHLMDMGIAKRADIDHDLTAVGIVMGTPYYMSPEQAKGVKDLDLRSDIYSLGASLYHMLTGHAPYEQIGTSASVMGRKLQKPPEDPRKFIPHISKPTLKLLKKMMSKEPGQRPQTWQEVKKLIRLSRVNKKNSSGSTNRKSLNSYDIRTKGLSSSTLIFSISTFLVVALLMIYLMTK